MYVDPHRMLTTMTAYLDNLSVLDRVEAEAGGSGSSLKLLYLYQQPHDGRYLGAWTVDTTDAGSTAAAGTNPGDTLQRLSTIPGLEIVDSMPPASGLAVFEQHQPAPREIWIEAGPCTRRRRGWFPAGIGSARLCSCTMLSGRLKRRSRSSRNRSKAQWAYMVGHRIGRRAA